MSNPYVGEIRMFAGSFAPAGWMFCEGQLLPISENEVLFNLVGTTYGGDGQETFALPDLRGRLPLHPSNDFQLAESGGVEQVTLTVQNIPSHRHFVSASADRATPAGGVSPTGALANTGGTPMYADASPSGLVNLSPSAIGFAGGSQPHDNMQPYLCVSFIISLYGVYPSQN